MDLTTSMRVGAVGNACCAFSKDLVGAFSASTGPAASTRRRSSVPPPSAGRLDAVPAFVETPQPHRAKVQVPDSVVDGLHPNRFVDQHGAHRQLTRVPGNGARHADTANFIMAGIRQRRKPR